MPQAINWAEGHTSPPEPGRYMRQYPKTAWSQAKVRRSYWDGRAWFHAEVIADGASKTPPHRLVSAFQFLPWRSE